MVMSLKNYYDMLIIHATAKEELLADAANAFPDECCGFFFGEEAGDDRIITVVRPVINAKEGDKRRRFEISAKDYLAAEQFADTNQLQLLGVYHSHPNHPAAPSEHDRVAAQPWFSYIIVSVLEGKTDAVRSWRLNEEQQFEEETIDNIKSTILNNQTINQ
jgi:proteasome lid subunit RPN8/RPN11